MDNSMDTLEPPQQDIAEQPTMTLWRRPQRPVVRLRIGRILALLALVSALLGGIGYGVGYGIGHRSASGHTAATAAQPTATTAWRFTWQQSGRGTAVLTPPVLGSQDTPRFLLSWTCRASREATKLIISIFQDDRQRRSVAYVSCPGYGNTMITVGSAPDDMLHLGAYSVLITAPDNAPWTLAVQESQAAR